MGIGDWGLGIGDWGLGIGRNPQSPIPNPHFKFIYKIKFIINNYYIYLIYLLIKPIFKMKKLNKYKN